MTREDVMVWSLLLGIANFVLTWGVALYMYLTNKNKATNARIDTLAQDLTNSIIDHGNRLTKVESGPTIEDLAESIIDHGNRLTHVEGRPTHQDLAQLHEKTNGVARDLSLLTGTVAGMNRLLCSIDDHLRSKAT